MSWFVRAPIAAIALQLNDLAWSGVQPDNCIMWRSSLALVRLSVPVAAVISLPGPPLLSLLSLLTTGSGEGVTDPTASSLHVLHSCTCVLSLCCSSLILPVSSILWTLEQVGLLQMNTRSHFTASQNYLR